jgi:diguanylate cyclase (GGDEF)-like protein
MNIDEPTLMMVLGVASITASAMFLALHASARHIAGIRLWAFGCLSVGFAVILDGPRLIETWQWASLLFNIPLVVGHALFLVGTAQFVGRPCPKPTLPLLAAVAVLLTVLFTLVVPDSVARIFSLSSFQAALNGLTAWLLWRHREPQSQRAYLVASAVTFAQAAATLAQALFVLTSSVTITYAAPQLPFANIVTWVAALSNILVGNWILFLLVMLRLVGELKAVAGHDSLTGLLNRRGLRSHIDSVTAPDCSIKALAVLLLDIDHFKMVNDQHGHDVGDKVVAMMGEVMRGLGSPHIVPCRWGGEEFCFVVDSFTEESLRKLAELARLEFHRVTRTHPHLPSGATVSIGLAVMEIDKSFEFSKLIALADSQLYRAKGNGRNRVCRASDHIKDERPEFMI